VTGVLVTAQQLSATGVGVEVDDDLLTDRAGLAAADSLGFGECFGGGWSAVFAVADGTIGEVANTTRVSAATCSSRRTSAPAPSGARR
jgi:hypothetical protein